MKHADGLVLAFDVGTSSVRTALFDGAGVRRAQTTAQVAYRLNYAPGGGAELAPLRLRRAANQCLGQTLAAYRALPVHKRPPIRGVGMSCFWHSLLGVDAHGHFLTPIYTWGDARCRPDAAALRERLDERQVHARTGCMLRTSFWPAKLAWLRRTDPRLFAKVRRWMSPAEWLAGEWGGAAGCGWSMASGTGLLDVRALRWDPAMLEAAGISASQLSALDENPDDAARIAPELAGVPWFPALGDGAASNLGSGAVGPGRVAINVGTSAALRLMVAGMPKAVPFGLFCYRVDARRCLVGGAVSNAGSLRAWCVRELRLQPAGIERALARRPRPDHGLTVLPFWTAERAPDWEEERRGTIIGITHETTALDLLQAALEASYYRIARIGDLVLAHAGGKPPQCIVSGGVQHSRSSLQRLANILGRPLHPSAEPEASLRGAAVYAWERLGWTMPAPRLTPAIRPQPANVRAYRAARRAAEAIAPDRLRPS